MCTGVCAGASGCKKRSHSATPPPIVSYCYYYYCYCYCYYYYYYYHYYYYYYYYLALDRLDPLPIIAHLGVSSK